MSGFAVSAKDWHWSLWEMVRMSSPLFIVLILFLPETSADNILLRRAQRLREVTGDPRFQAQSEIDQKNLKFRDIAIHALIKPVEIMLKDPAVFFVNMYTALFYVSLPNLRRQLVSSILSSFHHHPRCMLTKVQRLHTLPFSRSFRSSFLSGMASTLGRRD